jgi:DNA invertase Pin-like site-specific DNA recombinase
MTTASQPKPLRASQYVRMSTDLQQYSTQNQRDKIAQYAALRNIEITRTYADEGRSGLSFGGRAALRQLIADVEAGQIDFQLILVYDVSRWGRFQDADESAYYEYICKRAGIQVTYCAEQFENDGSPVSTIVKGVKRAMAGEYSRELSSKTFAGQSRLIELGFRQGGSAGYGLRRVLIDQSGKIKGELKHGDQKALQTDRVILVPGPAEEVSLVNDMFTWLIRDDLSILDIVRRLNAMGIKAENGKAWSKAIVQQVFTNEKYIGNNIFNRRSHKLQKLRVKNPPEMWIRKERAFEGIVPIETFVTAQNVLLARSTRYTNEELLAKLRGLYLKSGTLTAKLIAQQIDFPNANMYAERFGSMCHAYELVGFKSPLDGTLLDANRALKRLHADIIERTRKTIADLGGEVRRDPKTDLLHVNDELVICLVVARHQTTDNGLRRWYLWLDPARYSPDITVAIRMDTSNLTELDYYLLPQLELPGHCFQFTHRHFARLECFRFDSLDFLYRMSQRHRVQRPS